MTGKRLAKRLLLGMALVAFLLAALVLTYAYWVPIAARPIAKRYGVTFEKYEKLKNGRFALHDVVRTNRLFDLRIGRIEGFLPHVWWSRIGSASSASFVEVNGWKVVIHDRPTDQKARANLLDRSAYGEWKRIERSIALMREWLPKATLLNGSIEYKNREYALSVVTWEKGLLDGSGVWPVSAVPLDIKAKLTGELPYQLSYAMHPLDLRARLRVTETNQYLNAELAAFYKESRADLSANFGRTGLIPVTATLSAPDFKISADVFKLEQFSEIIGSLSAEWRTNQYTVELRAHAEPLVSVGQIPPVDVEISARGDTNALRIERAVSSLPGLQLALSDPLELSYQGKMLSARSEIQISAELEKLPWLKMNGRMEGTILLEKGRDLPRTTLKASGANLSGYRVGAGSVLVEGTVDWPKLERFDAQVRFTNNSSVIAKGSADLKTRVLSETVVQAEGPVLTNLLPGGIRFSNLKLSAKVSGSLSNMQHQGEIELREFVMPQLQPLAIEASWKAQQFVFDDLALRARAGPASILFRGSGYAADGRTNLVIRELNLLKGEEIYLKLANDSRFTVTTNAGSEMVFELEPMTLVGEQRQLSLGAGMQWPDAVAVEIHATNVNPSLFQFFATHSLRGLDLEQLNVMAGWSNSPVMGAIFGKFSIEDEAFQKLTTAVDMQLQTNGVKLKQLSVSNPKAEICRAHGFLPLTFHPRELEKTRFSRTELMEFEAETAANPVFWSAVASLTDLNLSNAAVRVSVHGSLENPTGELEVKAAGFELLRTNQNIPGFGPFAGRATLDQRMLRISEFSLRIMDQPVAMEGSLKLGENFWALRQEAMLKYAIDRAEGRLRAPEVNLAPFAEYLPRYLRAEGSISADVAMEPGRNFQGSIRVREVETRPLPKVGVVQKIEADLSLRGRKVLFENVSGVLGGERLSLSGSVDLSEESVAKGYPDLDFSIAGRNIPLARNPDVILRSDLDLRVRNGTNRIPVVSGTANLRDSFLLRDITTLVPGRVARPERRPPYFTLSQDPIDEWQLDVRVRGENFMRVRSPFFQGIVSANFYVTGTMEEPMALGEAGINSGAIIFPFATLPVRQALVSLTRENPYLPQIFAVASGRAFGFDVRMEVDGPADEPIVEFSSVPALTSEQIILMLTAGQIPRDDFGFSNQGRAGQLAFFVGKSLWMKMNPGQPADERLAVRSGEDVSEQGRQTYEVEYKINDRWSLVGEYDRFGDLNANLKWRVFSR